MTDTMHSRPIVTVPVGFGGKTPPYVPDPAPTLVLELPSTETLRDQARIEALEAAARHQAEAIITRAEQEAAQIREEARQESERAIEENEREAGRLAEERNRLAKLQTDLAAESATRQEEADTLSQRLAQLDERLARADDDVAEAGRILAQAREDAEAILEEARTAAESIVQDAHDHANAMRTEQALQDATDVEAMIAERVAEIESLHVIELSMLADREAELLARLNELEHRPEPVLQTTETESVEEASTDSVEIELRDLSERAGRHAADPADRTPRPIAAHAPLTEQLSASAFRTQPERKGRRRK